MVLAGSGGRLTYGYHIAARLGAWRLEKVAELGHSWNLKADVRKVDRFLVTQRPLDVELHRGHLRYRWKAVDVDDIGKKLALELNGAPNTA